MATKSQAYDAPLYQVRFSGGGEAGGTATTVYAKYAAWTSMVAYSVALTVAIVGTAGTSTWQVGKVGTSGTTTYALYTLATGAVATGTLDALPTASGAITLNPGEYLQVLSGGAATAKLAVGYELGLQNQGSVTV